MLRYPITWLLLLIFATALGACCGSVACECQDNLDDAIFFRFNVDTVGNPAASFRTAQLDSVFIRRVPRDTAQRPRADTVLLTGGRRGLVQTVVINNAQPFAQSGSRKLDQYDYKIYLGRRRAPTTSFIVDSVRLANEFVGDGCCTCNVNTRKVLRLDSVYFDLTDFDGQVKPDTVLLNRKM